ncbi:MAG: hypothetical protein FWF57_02085 [Defluviitaleaceae bacterium]|nr:hypothetical protein [Defluviitaleaceae bacterium]
MEELDKRIAIISNKYDKKETIKKTWEEQLSQTIEEIRSLHIELDRENTELEQLSFFNDSFSVYMPKDFKEVPLEIKKQKYQYEQRPQIIYQNKKGTVNIGFSVAEIAETKEELINLRNGMKNSFVSVSPSSKIFDTGDFTINENHIAYYTFNSYAVGGQMFNLIFIAFLGSKGEDKNKFLICNLNCLQKDMEKFKPFFYGFMNTIEIKEVTSAKEETELMEEEQEETPIEKQIFIPTDEKLKERVFFKKENLLNLSIIKTFKVEIGSNYNDMLRKNEGVYIDVFICKNEYGETPLNNIYALNEDGEICWTVQSEQTRVEKTNYSPFIKGGIRAKDHIYAVDEDNSIYTISTNNGEILTKEVRGNKLFGTVIK